MRRGCVRLGYLSSIDFVTTIEDTACDSQRCILWFSCRKYNNSSQTSAGDDNILVSAESGFYLYIKPDFARMILSAFFDPNSTA